MLSQESLSKIDREIAKYPAEQKQSAVMAALHFAQQEKGWLARETIADVARQAGLSLGIVNFYFDSKERLLAECLRHLAEAYRQTWMAAMAAAGPDPARRLEAMMLADFDPAASTPERLAAWIAFWGETQGRPTYDEICAAFDAERLAAAAALCRDLVTASAYPIDAGLAARTLEALGDGGLDASQDLPPTVGGLLGLDQRHRHGVDVADVEVILGVVVGERRRQSPTRLRDDADAAQASALVLRHHRRHGAEN